MLLLTIIQSSKNKESFLSIMSSDSWAVFLLFLHLGSSESMLAVKEILQCVARLVGADEGSPPIPNGASTPDGCS